MRRLAVELAPSRAGLWSRRLALFAAAVALIGLLLGRSEAIDMRAALAVLGAALAMALAAMALAVAAFVVVWNDGRPGTGAAATGLILALLLAVFPGYLAARAVQLPALNDVTTDLVDPPRFSSSRLALDKRAGRVPPDPGPDIRASQQAAYPAVAPVILDLAPERAFALALKAAANQGWEVYESVPISRRGGLGRFDALDHTPVLRFTDDIAVRVRPLASGARVDIRSASRLGRHDFGTNARRIERFAAELSALADDEPDAKN